MSGKASPALAPPAVFMAGIRGIKAGEFRRHEKDFNGEKSLPPVHWRRFRGAKLS